MAEFRRLQQPGVPNILEAFRTGANVAQTRQSNEFARQQYSDKLAQLSVENKRVEEDRKRADSEYEYNQGRREVSVNKELGDIEGMNKGFRRSMAASGMVIPEEMPISQEVVDRWHKVTSIKDPADQDIAEEKFAKEIGESVNAYGRRLKAFGGDVSEFEAGQAAEAVIGTEQRKLTGQKELETFKTGEQIRQDQAKITAETAARKERPLSAATKANKLFVNKAGVGRYVNVNDPTDVTNAGKQGFAPPVAGTAPKSIKLGRGAKLLERNEAGDYVEVASGEPIVPVEEDATKRELNAMEKIGKLVTKEADELYTKLQPKQIYDNFNQEWVDNPKYPFDERAAFVARRTIELRQKFKLDTPDEVIDALKKRRPSSSDLSLQNGKVEGVKQGAIIPEQDIDRYLDWLKRTNIAREQGGQVAFPEDSDKAIEKFNSLRGE